MKAVHIREIELIHLPLLLNNNNLYLPRQISLQSSLLSFHYKLPTMLLKKVTKKMMFLKIFFLTLQAMPMILHQASFRPHLLVLFVQHLISRMQPQRAQIFLQVKGGQLPDHKRHPTQSFLVY